MIDWSKVKGSAQVKDELMDQVIASRIAAYREESDPIRFEIEYDAISNGNQPDFSAWIKKVKEIKERYPKP